MLRWRNNEIPTTRVAARATASPRPRGRSGSLPVPGEPGGKPLRMGQVDCAESEEDHEEAAGERTHKQAKVAHAGAGDGKEKGVEEDLDRDVEHDDAEGE